MALFFNRRWYECLDNRHSGLPLEQVPTRLTVQDHMVELHRRIWTAEGSHRSYDLHPHWNERNLTCYVFPNPYNEGHVREIFVRYGKSRRQILSFGEQGLDEESSFRHHVHVAFGLAEDAFFFQLAFSPWAFQDYAELRRVLAGGSSQAAHRLVANLSELGNAEYVIWGPNGLHLVCASLETPEQLLSALPANTEGWIVFRRNIDPSDEDLDSERIVETCLGEIHRLYPIFDAVALRQPRGQA